MSDRAMVFGAARGGFYPAGAADCEAQLTRCLAQAEVVPAAGRVVAGVVPHAGWAFSGPTAAWTFKNLRAELDPPFETVIVFGAIHVPGVPVAAVWPDGRWDTPLGPIEVDAALATELVASGVAVVDRQAHAREHAVEVELPFVRRVEPQARLLAVSVPPDERAAEIGRQAARAARRLGRRTIALASTDLTHYGRRFGFDPRGTGDAAHQWARDVNDRAFLDAAAALDEAAVIELARTQRSACGAGAVAATQAYARELGATAGELLHHTTSYEVRPQTGCESFVGYAAMRFLAG